MRVMFDGLEQLLQDRLRQTSVKQRLHFRQRPLALAFWAA